MGLLDRGTAWLSGQLKQAAGATATYVRGSRRSTVTVVRKPRTERGVNVDGITETTREHSIIVAVDGFPYSAPQAGNLIEETIDGVTVTWEAVPVANEPVFRWWDRAKTAYEIDVIEA